MDGSVAFVLTIALLFSESQFAAMYKTINVIEQSDQIISSYTEKGAYTIISTDKGVSITACQLPANKFLGLFQRNVHITIYRLKFA
jgi:hypothetical protein